MRTPSVLRAILVSATLLLSFRIPAATILWTNTTGGFWNIASNWSPNTVPASGDTVYITNAGSYAVSVNVNATLGDFFVGSVSGRQTVTVVSVTLTLNGTGAFGTNSVFELAGGTLDGTGTNIFAGAFNWSSGVMDSAGGGGRTVFTNSATVSITTGNLKSHYRRTIDSYATVNWTGGQVNTGFSAVWNNYGGSLFDIQNDLAAVFVGGGTPAFNNSGTLRKSGGAGAATFQYAVNSGNAVSCSSGVLSLGNGGTSSGSFSASPGNSVDFSGGIQTLIAGTTFSGSGAFRINSSGTLNFAAPITVTPAFELAVGGTIDGTNVAVFAGPFTWSGGVMDSAFGAGGRTVFTNSATVSITTGNIKTHYRRTVDNYTTVNWIAGQINVGFGAVWNNYGGALFDIQNDLTAAFVGGSSAVFNNSGILRKSAGAGAATLQYAVNNGNTVSCSSGVLGLGNGGTSSGGFGTTPGSFLDFSGGTHTLLAGTGFGGNGLFRVNGSGTLNVAGPVSSTAAFELAVGGTIDGTNVAIFAGPFTWSGGVMDSAFGAGGRTVFTNSATVSITTGNIKTHYRRTIDSYTTVNWSGGQINTGFSSAWNNYSSATLDIQNDLAAIYVGGGTPVFNNLGVLRKSGGPTTAAFQYAVNNANLVSCSSGVLGLGNGGTSSGAFATTSGTFLDFNGATHTLIAGAGFSGAGLFRVNGSGTLNFAAPITVTPSFELAVGGTIDGTNVAVFAGPFTWSGGVMDSAFGAGGRTVFTNSATVSITTGNLKTHYRRMIDNYTTVNWTGGQINIGFGALWNNMSQAVLDIQGDLPAIFVGGGGAVFNSLGILRKSAGASTATFQYAVNNGNLVSSSSGILSLGNGGTSSGTFSNAAGTFVDFSGSTHTLIAGAGFRGAGLFRVNGSGTLNFAAPITVTPSFELAVGGTIDGTNVANFAGPFTWSGGVMDSAFGAGGRTVFTNSATVNITTGNIKTHYHRTIDNYTTVNWAAGQINIGFGAIWNNYSGSLFDVQNDLAAVFVGGGGTVFNNSGTLRKNAGVGVATFQYNINNGNLVRSQSGVFDFPVSYIQTNGTTELSGGNFSGITFDIRGGLLTGSGNVAANVINGGQVAPGSGVGLLTISNSIPQSYSSTTNSLLTFQIGGLAPVTQHDQFRVNGNATLAGALRAELANGYSPTVGNVYTVMTFTARSGQFTNFVFPEYEFAVLQTATNIILIASNALPAVTLTGVPGTQEVCRVFTIAARAFDLENGLTNLAFLADGDVVSSIANPVNNQFYGVKVAHDYPGFATFSARVMDNKGGVKQTNLTTLFYAAPLHIITPGGFLSNAFRLCMVGETGKAYRVFSSTNVGIPGSNWLNLGQMELLTNGPLRFIDTNATNFPMRYYRARQEP